MTNTPDKSEMEALERVERRLNNAWAKHGFMTLAVSDLREVVSLARASSRHADQVPDMVERVARAMFDDELDDTPRRDREQAWEQEKLIWLKNAEAAIAALQAVPAEVGEKESVYRDIFAEITAKAQPLCEDESDPEKITGYRLPVGPLHRAAGKTGFQMFNGEAHLARAVRDIDRLKTTLKQVKVLLISAASRDSHMAPEYERRKAREATDVIDTALKASGEE